MLKPIRYVGRSLMHGPIAHGVIRCIKTKKDDRPVALDDAISLLVARYGAIEPLRPTLAIDVPDDLTGSTLHILGQTEKPLCGRR